MKTVLRRTIHPEVRVMDEKAGIATYVASDESLDSYREVIRANGWRFDLFQKNAPFVNSHNYWSIEDQLGKVVDFQVKGKQLEETVQWAIDVPENKMAQLGWAMTKGGYLRAVSVGFYPEKAVSKWDRDLAGWRDQLKELGYKEDDGPRVVYLEQQQIELSACIIGANQNALAKAYKAGVVTDADIEMLDESLQRGSFLAALGDAAIVEEQKRISGELSETVNSAEDSAAAELAWQRKQRFLDEFEKAIRGI